MCSVYAYKIMKLFDYLKDHFVFLFSQFVLILFMGLILDMISGRLPLVMLLCFTGALILFFGIWYDYSRKSRYYKHLYDALNTIPKKQYISSVLRTPTFLEAEILVDVLKQTTKAMNDEIASSQISSNEYREYIETWIHEIKVPISCISLICENNKSEFTGAISDEIDRISSYVEQALYYARSTNVEKDYSIRSISLENVVKSAIKKHSKQLISENARIVMKDLDKQVFSDPKWMDFILGQIISNSIKYKRDDFSLTFCAKDEGSSIALYIIDDGIGIPSKDLPRVTEKGFTGENGRRFAKSTGLGLFLCRQLCTKMHLGFHISSVFDTGTTISIIFPKDKLLLLED